MRKFVWTALLLALCATVALAQTTTGSIYGTVKTAEGLVITDAKVTLTAGHIPTKTTLTSSRGTFRFADLPIGSFTLKFEKEGYQTLVLEDVMVRLGAASRVDVALEVSATEQVITITGETAVVDLKKTGTQTNLTQDLLANIPTARDPWVVLDQVAGMQTDRVNVGGSESGQQSNFISHGDSGDNAVWSVDGVMVTDMAATGASPIYWDFDSFDEMQITTSGSDATMPTGGVQLNFITKQGSDTFHGQGSVYYTNDSLQGKNIPADLEARGYRGNQISYIKDYGFDVGGPIWKGNIWFWGAYRVQDIALLTISGTEDKTKLENYNIKFTGQAGDRNRWTFFYTRGNKTKHGRGAAWNRPPETTYDQEGPTPIYKVEDTFLASENLIINAKFSYVYNNFGLEPIGGRSVNPWRDDYTGMYGGTSSYYLTIRPAWQFVASAEDYIDQAFGGSHEVKAGFEYRLTPVTSLSGYGTDIFLAYYNGEPSEAWLCGKSDAEYRSVRWSLYLTDIFNRDRFTFNVGVRYDRQWGNNRASTATGNAIIPDLIPDLNYPGDSSHFTWSNFVPRLGMTYDIFGDGKTILRANFSMYADQLGAWIPTYTNPLGWREIDYEWTDLNGDNEPQANELGSMIWYGGVNPYAAPGTDLLDNGTRFDPDLSAPMTYEFLIGGEREVMPNLSVAATYIYRLMNNFWWAVDDNLVNDPYEYVGTITQSGYTAGYYQPTDYPAGTREVTLQPDYKRVFQGIELTATKRLSDKWMANMSFYYGDTKQYYDSAAAYTDPTSIDMYNGASYAPQTSGSGKSAIYINSRWSFRTSAMYQFPWDINVSGYFAFREGFCYPIFLRTGYRDYDAGRAYPLAEPMGETHLPSVATLDMRLEKVFRLQEYGRLGIILDIFNIFNNNAELGRNNNAYSGSFGLTTEIVNPRLFRLGLRFQF
jgi:hypothetical protein